MLLSKYKNPVEGSNKGILNPCEILVVGTQTENQRT